MKKFLSFILLIAMVLSMAACGESSSFQTPIKKSEFSETAPNIILGITQFQVVDMYETDDVIPPKPGSVYVHYEADAGSKYIVVVMNVINNGDSAVSISDLFEFTAEIGGKKYTATPVVETDNGSSLESYYKISPLEKARVHYLLQVPESVDANNIRAKVVTEKETMTGVLNLETFENAVIALSKGSLILDGKTVEATLVDVFTTDALYPPYKDGYYTYFPADDGMVYLVAQFTIKNVDGKDMDYDAIAGVKCVYKDKYKYSSFAVFQEDGGRSLSSYTSTHSLAPLESNTVYYLMQLPKEAENGPIEIKFYIAGQNYKYLFG